MGLNRVHFLGAAKLETGGRGDVKYLQSGTAVLNARLLVADSYEKDGQSVASEEDLPITLWGKAAEKFASEVVDGTTLYVEGKVTNRKRQGKNGGEFDNVSISVSKWVALEAKALVDRRDASEGERMRPATRAHGDDNMDAPEDDGLPFMWLIPLIPFLGLAATMVA